MISVSGHLSFSGAVRLTSVDTYLALAGCLAVFDPRTGFVLKSGRFINLSNLASPANSLYAPIQSNGLVAVTDTSTFGGVTASRQAAQSVNSAQLAQAGYQLSQLHKAASTVYTVIRVSTAFGSAQSIWTSTATGTPGLALGMNTVNCNSVFTGAGAAGSALFTQIVKGYAYFVGDVLLIIQRLTGPTVNTAICTTSGSTNTVGKTFVVVSALPAAIAGGTVLAFLNGTTVTVASGGAAAGATSIPLAGTIPTTIAAGTSAGVGLASLTGYAPTTSVTITTNAAAAAGATSLAVQPLPFALWTGYVIPFAGVNATLSAPAAAGATTLAVTALPGAIASGASATRIHGGVWSLYSSRNVTGTTTLDQNDGGVFKLLGGNGNNNVLFQAAFSDVGLSAAALAARDARMANLLRDDFAAYLFSGLL